MHAGTLLQVMPFKNPLTAVFFQRNPNTLIVACRDGILLVDVITQSVQPFSDTPQGVGYFPNAVSLAVDGSVVVVGNNNAPFSVCGYDPASRKRLWILNTASYVGAVCVHDAQVLVSVSYNPTLVLDLNTGTQIAALLKADGAIYGLGVIEGVCFIVLFELVDSLSDHTSVYLSMLQHLLFKQVQPLHLPLEMWDWIAKYRV